MVVRIKIAIEQEEYSALLALALTELRSAEDQLHFIMRQSLLEKGFLGENQQQAIDGGANNRLKQS